MKKIIMQRDFLNNTFEVQWLPEGSCFLFGTETESFPMFPNQKFSILEITKLLERGMNLSMLQDGFYLMDCFAGMDQIEDRSIDMILCDLPYGKTHCRWDSVLPFDRLWKAYNRIIKDNGAIVLFGTEPFSSYLRISNICMYKYDWIWDKVIGTNFLNAKKQPLRNHENISVFYKKQCTYHPQMTEGHTPVHNYTKHTGDGECYGHTKQGIKGGGSTSRYPRSIQVFSRDTQKSSVHPTQKPVTLCEYLIRTYTDPGELVLDTCAGSCTTGIAAYNTGRRFLGFENDTDIFKKGYARLTEHKNNNSLLRP